MSELKCCPICGKEIDIETDLYIPERDWKPTFYDPDSGGDPINIYCKCGLEFSTGTYDWNEFVNAWNTRTPMANIVENIVTSLESEKTVFLGTRTEQTDTILIDDAINIVKQEINNGENNT